MKTKAQIEQEQVAAQALLDFTSALTFEGLCDAVFLLIDARADYDEATADDLCSRIAKAGWARRRGMVS